MASGKTSKIPILDTLESRMSHLVNNPYLSDVTFLVGKPGQIMYGHKVVLSLASDVLYALFNGHFAEAQQDGKLQPIAVPDIAPSAFSAILRFIYYGHVGLTKGNVLEIYYAAKKYMLSPLESECEAFFRHSINETNALKIFDDNRSNEFEVVNGICLDIICDNPLLCFKYDLSTMKKRSIEMIAVCPSMNCLREQLLEAIKKWLVQNKASSEDATDLLGIIPAQHAWVLNCQKNTSFGDFGYNSNLETTLTIKIAGPTKLFLYGLGVWVGTQDECIGTASFKVEINSRVITNTSVTLKADLYIKEVMFEKEIITCTKPCSVKVIMKSDKNGLFYMNAFRPVKRFDPDKNVGVGFGVPRPNNYSYNGYNTTQRNCVAHLYYNVN